MYLRNRVRRYFGLYTVDGKVTNKDGALSTLYKAAGSLFNVPKICGLTGRRRQHRRATGITSKHNHKRVQPRFRMRSDRKRREVLRREKTCKVECKFASFAGVEIFELQWNICVMPCRESQLAVISSDVIVVGVRRRPSDIVSGCVYTHE